MLDVAAQHQPLTDLLQRQLEEVTIIFERQLASELSAVNSLCAHIERYRGKMLRPTLVLLSGLASRGGDADESQLTERHRMLAAVVEMIHMATLVHDDVLDEAEVRRRGASVNHLRGNETAVMLGDYLISNAYHLCSQIGEPSLNLALGEVTNTVCEGELLQLRHRDDYGIDEATYFEIIDRKTASLIAACCGLGATVSGADDAAVRALRDAGRTMGRAFQVQDDLLDLTGEEGTVGKSLGLDLIKGKLTLPLILLLDRCDPHQRGTALRLIDERNAERLRDLLQDHDCIDATRGRAHSLVAEAKMQLELLPGGPARDLLAAMADAIITRAF